VYACVYVLVCESYYTYNTYIYIHLCAYKGWCSKTIHHLLRRRRNESRSGSKGENSARVYAGEGGWGSDRNVLQREWEGEKDWKRARQERNNNVKNAFFSLQRSWNGRASRRAHTHTDTHSGRAEKPRARTRGGHGSYV